MATQPSLWGDEPRREPQTHLPPIKTADGKLLCRNCRTTLNKHCPASCPQCSQPIDRRRLK